MDNWDEAKLEEVVDQKHGESNKKMPQTAIVSHSYPFVGSSSPGHCSGYSF